MLIPFLLLSFQTGINAGPTKVSCDGATVTLQAFPSEIPTNYTIRWDDAIEDGVFLVVNVLETTSYRVVLTDLDTMIEYEDVATVLVHPGDPDLVPDGVYDTLDWRAFFAAWLTQEPDPDFDPDGDGRISVLDWFYFCNHDVDPPNTPPLLTVSNAVTPAGDTVLIDTEIEDAEQVPQLVTETTGDHGFAFILDGNLRYTPQEFFVGTDSFLVYVTDGIISTPSIEVEVQVIEPDTFANLYNDIFFNYCWACHIDAVSGGLSLSTYQSAQTGGNSGAGFVAGFPLLSPIFLRVATGSMPLGMDPLSTLEIERIRLWIVKGAEEE